MNIVAIMKRIFRQFRRDRRSLALMIVAPLFILTLLWLVLDVEDYEPVIAAVEAPQAIVAAMEEAGATMLGMDREQAEQALQDQEIDAYLQIDPQQVHMMLEGSDPAANGAVLRVMQQAMQALNPQPFELELGFLHGSEELNVFDRTGPVLIGLFIFFFIFLLGGVSFLRERTQGTLERLLATPIKRWELCPRVYIRVWAVHHSAIDHYRRVLRLRFGYLYGGLSLVCIAGDVLAGDYGAQPGHDAVRFCQERISDDPIYPARDCASGVFLGGFSSGNLGTMAQKHRQNHAPHLRSGSAAGDHDPRTRICVDRYASFYPGRLFTCFYPP